MRRRLIYNGYATLLSVIILGALLSTLATTLFPIAPDALRTTMTHKDGQRAMVAALECSEEALEQIRVNTSYSGTVTRSGADYDCSAVVTITGATARTLAITGTSGSARHRVVATTTTILPTITLSTWQTVGDVP